MQYEDLAPEIFRQRMVIEGYPLTPISDSQISAYLAELSNKLEMTLLTTPVTHRSDKFGWAGWIHWETSGAHFYAWDMPTLFYSVDIYTCKKFCPEKALDYTRTFFNSHKIVGKEF